MMRPRSIRRLFSLRVKSVDDIPWGLTSRSRRDLLYHFVGIQPNEGVGSVWYTAACPFMPPSQNQRDQRTVSLLSSYAEGELIVLEVLPLALTRVRDTEYSRRGEGEDDAAGLDVLSDLFPASPVNVEKVKHTVERVSK